MQRFRAIFFSLLYAGVVVGLLVTFAQQISTAPLILRAEVYEKAAEATARAGPPALQPDHAVAGHDHDQPAWEPADGFERTAYSAAANILTAIGFALVLCGVVATQGGLSSWRVSLVWGLAGFAVFFAAPSLGLPPKLPGMPTADLEPRQVWWIATAAATAAGLGLLAYRRSALTVALAGLLIVAPHVIGAPQAIEAETNVPGELARDFVVAASVCSFLFWTVLGSATGAIYRRFSA